MLSLRTERLLAQFFTDVAQAEQRVEAMRETLALSASFTPGSVFARIDRYAFGSVDSADLVRFLDSLGIYVREAEARQIIKQYDSNSDGRLSEQDFLQLTLPAANPTVRSLALERRAGIYTAEVAVTLTRLAELELAYHRGVQDDVRDIRLQDDFSLSAAFSAAALPLSNYITRASLRSLLSKHGPAPAESSLDSIFRRLDTDGDERLTYSEFSAPFTEVPRAERPYSPAVDRTSRSSRSLRNPSDGLRSSQEFNRSLRSTTSLEPDPRLSSRSLKSPTRSLSRGALRASYTSSLSASQSFRSTLSPRYEPAYTSSLYSSSRYGSSRLPSSSRDALVSYFQERISFLREAEVRRRELSLDYDFNLEDAFRFFDRYDKGYVTAADLEEGLYALGGVSRPGDIRLLVTEYSASAYSKLAFGDFCDMLLPAGVRRYGSQSVYGVDRRNPFRALTKSHLLDLFQLLLETERRVEAHRQALQRLPSFNALDAFNTLDQDRDNNLTASELRYFLDSSGLRATEKELLYVLATLDKDRDGRVNSREFVDALSPKAVERYY